MFNGFSRVWTPVLRAHQIEGKPRLVHLASERLVLFRNEGGKVGALLDQCPHRGASLSQGRVTPAGRIECPFHGWQFDRLGHACHVPLNPNAKLHFLSARALPVREIGDLVWIYTAPGTEDVAEPQVPAGLVSPSLSRTYVQRLWRCHWTRAMENMLDSPHLPFVHRRTIGKPMRERMTPTSQMEIVWEDTPYGGRAEARMDGHAGGAILEYFKPNIMVLNIPVPGKILTIHALVVPERPGHTRLIICQSRDFARWRVWNPFFYWMNKRIADEDKNVVESAGIEEVPPAATEHSVASDRATLQFRKYYYEELRTSVF